MADCPCLSQCPFNLNRMINLPDDQDQEELKMQYCHNQFEKCARYKVYKVLGQWSVPYNLFPTQRTKVAAIILKAAEQIQAPYVKVA